VAANNISNANQDGYTQKTVNVGAVVNGGEASGVNVTGFTRATDVGLVTSYNASTSDASFYGTQNDYLKKVQAILDSTSDNPLLSDAVAKFQSAWTEYSAAPESASQQQRVILAGSNLVSQIQSISTSVVNLGREVVNDTNDTISGLNSYLLQIADLNQQISSAGPTGSGTGDLQDSRDQIINKVAAITNVKVVERSNGTIALYTPQGVPLVDISAQTFTYNGSTITSASGRDVTNDLRGGSLEARLNFVYDGSPTAVTSTPGTEVIRKLNSQLIALANAFTGTSGSPTTFAAAYNNAATQSGELASDFFTYSVDSNGDAVPSSLAVNANLLNGTSKIKQGSGSAVNTAFTAVRSFTADGLGTVSGTYSDLSASVLSSFQQAASIVDSLSSTATAQQSYYKENLSNATGVNVDNELVQLTILQNSYAASAHVMTTINELFKTLIGVLG
jgi:flagellar hook-associated protein 1 FlgK